MQNAASYRGRLFSILDNKQVVKPLVKQTGSSGTMCEIVNRNSLSLKVSYFNLKSYYPPIGIGSFKWMKHL